VIGNGTVIGFYFDCFCFQPTADREIPPTDSPPFSILTPPAEEEEKDSLNSATGAGDVASLNGNTGKLLSNVSVRSSTSHVGLGKMLLLFAL